MEYLSTVGVYTTSVEYLSTWGGGGTPLQWNIYPEGEVHHLNGILIHRGAGVHHLSGIFFPASHFSQCPVFHPFFFFWGGVFPCVAWTPILPNFQFS